MGTRAKILHLRLNELERTRAEKLARHYGITLSALVRKLVAEERDRVFVEPKRRERFWKEIEEGYEKLRADKSAWNEEMQSREEWERVQAETLTSLTRSETLAEIFSRLSSSEQKILERVIADHSDLLRRLAK